MSDTDKKAFCLDSAKDAVCGDRHLNYGSAEDNFTRIRDLWNAWFATKYPDIENPFTKYDVAMMMILMKVARLAHTPGHKDSWIDIAGYAACGYDVTSK